MRNQRVKTRKSWVRNPATRIKQSEKDFSRTKEKSVMKEILEDAMTEIVEDDSEYGED